MKKPRVATPGLPFSTDCTGPAEDRAPAARNQVSSSNRLPILAATIRQAHADIVRGAIAVAERALDAGAALIEAKAALPHGQWATWLQDNIGVSARTARRYMQLAESGIKTATVAELGIKGAAAAVAKSSTRNKTEPCDDPEYLAWFSEVKAELAALETDDLRNRALSAMRQQVAAEQLASLTKDWAASTGRDLSAVCGMIEHTGFLSNVCLVLQKVR